MSKCRRDRRRANVESLEAPGYVACPQCHEPKRCLNRLPPTLWSLFKR
ncbi:MAG: 50S ribosomal protein L32 [Veillonella parvula]